MTDLSPPADLGDQIRAEAQARRDRAEYPDDLERHLDRHFHAIVTEGRGDKARLLREQVGRLRANVALAWEAVPATSRVPGGSALHAFVARSIERQLGPVLAQLHEFTEAVAAILDLEAEALAEVRAHLDALAERVADGAVISGEEVGLALDALAQRVASLERAVRDPLPPSD